MSARFHHLPLTLRQLQYVVAVAEVGTFRGAANVCGVSQPALSTQVAEVEAQLGVQLFERSSRGVRLTSAGDAVVPRARAALAAAEDVVLAARAHEDPLTGALSIGVIPTIAPYLLPDLDPALRAAWPDLDLTWVEAQTAVLVERIRGGDLDGALLSVEADLGWLNVAEVSVDPFVLAAPENHPLAAEVGPVGTDALATGPVLLLEDGHCFRDQALDVCARAGVDAEDLRATSLTTLVQMAAGRGAVTLLPAMAVEVENRRAAMVVRPFVESAPHRTVAFAWRPGSPLSDAFERLAASARGCIEGRGGPAA